MPLFTATADVKSQINGQVVKKGGTIELSERRGAWLIAQGYPLQAPAGFVGPSFSKRPPATKGCGCSGR